MASSCVYRDLLLKKRHGLPLWIPDPAQNLEEHKKHGISIGDLGILTDDGGFRYLFNVHAEADAPINLEKGTPQSFTPLPMPSITQRGFFHVEKACLTENASVEVAGSSGAQANALVAGVGVDLTFTITHERAAMLYLPHGADREDTDGIRSYSEYAIQHAESWYKFVNEELKSDARNGSLYLVTGCDKSGSWALGAGSPRQGSSFKFAIQGSSAVVPASVTADFHVAWTNTSGIEGRHYPPLMKHTVDVKNQCVFVRGLTIAIRTNWLTKPWLGKVRITEINTSTGSFSAVDNSVPFQSAAKQNPALLKASSPPPPQKSANKSLSGELPMPLPEPPEVSSEAVDCICGFVFDDGFSIACDVCSRWCHSACFGISQGGPVPESFLCWVCRPMSVNERDAAVRMQRERLAGELWDKNESLSGELLDQEQNEIGFYYSEDSSGVVVGNYPEFPKPVLSPGSYIGERLLSIRPDIDLVVVHDNDWMTVTSSDDENIFTSDGTDYEHLMTRILQKSHLEVTQGMALTLRRPYQDLAETIADFSVRLLDEFKDEVLDMKVASASMNLIDEIAERSYTIPSILSTRKEEESEFQVGFTAEKEQVIEYLMLLKDKRSHTRATAVSMIASISKQPELIMTIKESIPDILNFLEDTDFSVRKATVLAIAEFSKKSELVIAIKEGIPNVVNLLKDGHPDVRKAAVLTISCFSKQSELVIAIKEGVSDVFSLLEDTIFMTAVSAVAEFLKQPELLVTIKENIPNVFKSLKHDHGHIHKAFLLSMIAQFSKQPELATAIKEGIPDVLKLLKDKDYSVRKETVKVIVEFSKQPKLVMAIKGGISDVLNLLKDNDFEVLATTVSAIAEFSKQPELIVAIKKGIPNVFDLLKDKRSYLRGKAALKIAQFSKQPELVIVIKEGIPDVLNLLKDRDYIVRKETVSAIAEFSEQPELVIVIKEGIPDVLNLLKDEDWSVRKETVSAIAEFSKQPELVIVIKENIPDVLNLLKDGDYNVRKETVSAIAKFSKQPDLLMIIKESIPDILLCLKDEKKSVREAAIVAISEFSKQPDLVTTIAKCIPDIFLCLKDVKQSVRDAAIGAIREFSKQPDLVIAIDSAMPILLTVAKKDNPDGRVAALSVIHELYQQCIISM